jgi:hypothetical protein
MLVLESYLSVAKFELGKAAKGTTPLSANGNTKVIILRLLPSRCIVVGEVYFDGIPLNLV